MMTFGYLKGFVFIIKRSGITESMLTNFSLNLNCAMVLPLLFACLYHVDCVILLFRHVRVESLQSWNRLMNAAVHNWEENKGIPSEIWSQCRAITSQQLLHRQDWCSRDEGRAWRQMLKCFCKNAEAESIEMTFPLMPLSEKKSLSAYTSEKCTDCTNN